LSNIVMIADDDPRIRSVVRLYLEAEDFRVIEVENGAAAIKQLNETQID